MKVLASVQKKLDYEWWGVARWLFTRPKQKTFITITNYMLNNINDA